MIDIEELVRLRGSAPRDENALLCVLVLVECSGWKWWVYDLRWPALPCEWIGRGAGCGAGTE